MFWQPTLRLRGGPTVGFQLRLLTDHMRMVQRWAEQTTAKVESWG